MLRLSRVSSRLAARAIPAERQDRLLGTAVSQRVYGIHARHCIELARAELMRLHGLWSGRAPDSDVRRLARRAGSSPMIIDADTYAVLCLAKHLAGLTGGAFDVTAAPLSILWRNAALRGCLPQLNEIAAAASLVRAEDIRLGPGLRASLRREGQGLDLGGIGKGYAADACARLYVQRGIRHALIDLGGNVVVVGTRPDGSPWRVGVRAPGPDLASWIGYVEATDCAVATSASHERRYEIAGRQFSHIVDPATGMPIASDAVSATIVAPSSSVADALATAALVMGVSKALAFLDELARRGEIIGALIVDGRGGLHVTPGLTAAFHSHPASPSSAHRPLCS